MTPKSAEALRVESSCWVWVGTLDGAGYPRLSGRRIHREVVEAVAGPVPVGLVVHHKCHTRACYRPSHLAILTRAQHAAEHNPERRRAACPRGHDMDQHGREIAGGGRTCRACCALRQGHYNRTERSAVSKRAWKDRNRDEMNRRERERRRLRRLAANG